MRPVTLVIAALSLLCGLIIGGYGAPTLVGFKRGLLTLAEGSRGGEQETLPSYYESQTAYLRKLPGTADVVMLGDSLTEFGDWHELLPGIDVMNRGLRGDTSQGVYDRLDEVLSRKPRIVVLMTGINDLQFGTGERAIVATQQRIVRRLLDAGVRPVIVSTLYPGARLAPRLSDSVTEINRAMAAWSRGKCLTYLDLNKLLGANGKLPPAMTWDGLHITGEAYLIWRRALLPILKQ